MEVRPVSGRRLLLALGVWIPLAGAGLAAAAGVVRLAPPAWSHAYRADLLAGALLEAYLALLLALLIAFGGVVGVRLDLGFRFTSAADLGRAFVTWMACLVGGAILEALFAPLLGQPTSNTAGLLRTSFDPLFVVLVVATVCVIAPAAEELFFRGAFYGWVRRELPVLAAIPLTAIVFASAHVIVPLMPTLFVFGLGAAWIRERTGSTLNSFAMHATQNTFAVAITYLMITH
jgi:membrane protease YdiL (CAAX protease family)